MQLAKIMERREVENQFKKIFRWRQKTFEMNDSVLGIFTVLKNGKKSCP